MAQRLDLLTKHSAPAIFLQPQLVRFASQEHRQVGDSPFQGRTSIPNGPQCLYQPKQAPNLYFSLAKRELYAWGGTNYLSNVTEGTHFKVHNVASQP